MQIKSHLLSTLTLVTILYSTISFAQPSPPLKLVKSPGSNEGVSVFKKDDASASALEAKGVVKIDAPLSLVFNVVADNRYYTQWMPFVKKAEMQKKDGGYITTNTIEHSLLIDDREVTTWNTISCEPIAIGSTEGPKMIRIKFTAKDEHIPDFVPRTKNRAFIHGLIRVPEMEGYWLLQPGNTPNETQVTLQAKIDLAGSLTKALKAMAVEALASDTLKKLRKQVQSYQSKNQGPDYGLLKQNVPVVFDKGCITAPK